MEYLILFFVSLLIYFPTFKYGLVVDDVSTHRGIDKCKMQYRKFPLRIVGILNGVAPIQNVFIDRCLTFSLHTICCMLIYKVFNSLPVSLLFLVNVSNNQGSLWLNGKRYVVNTIICLLALLYTPIGILLWFITPYFQASAVTFPIVIALKGYWYLAFLVPTALFVGQGFLLRWASGKYKSSKVKEYTHVTYKKIFFISFNN